MDDRHNLNKIFSEKAKFILNGRIYPAIKSCVNNRYKIVLSFFAFHAFILNADIDFIIKHKPDIIFLGSILFSLFVIHNFINYAMNAHEECILEDRNYLGKWLKSSILEILFSVLMLTIIWIAHVFL